MHLLRGGLAATSTALLLAACGGPTPPPPNTPVPTPDPLAGVVQSYFDNLAHNCPAAYAMFDTQAQTALGTQSAYCGSFHDDTTSVDLGAVTRDGLGTASVDVKVHKADGSSHSDAVDLLQQNGTWLVDNVRPATQTKGTAAFDMEALPQRIATQYRNNTGHAIAITCELTGTQYVKVGDSVLCSFQWVSDPTKSGRIKITATSFDGWIWHTVDTAGSSPTAAPMPCSGAFQGPAGQPQLAAATPCGTPNPNSVPSA